MEKKKPKVAVITRTKDRVLLLERAIKSVHGQTMEDYIHVIINDGGDVASVDSLVKKYSDIINGRIKVIHNKTSSGMEAASNKAIKSVDSYFVAIHDDDDSWHPDFLARTTEHMEETGSMGVVVTTDRIIEEIKDGKVKTLSVDRWLPDLREINLYKQCRDNYATPITFIYRRSVFDQIGYYDERLPVAGDWDFALRFLLHYDIDFLRTEKALAFYHHRPSIQGVDGNSVFQDNGAKHAHYLNLLANKYLREELKEGKLGIGYIINKLIDDNGMRERFLQRGAELTDGVARAHTNGLHDRLNQLEERISHLMVARTSVSRRARNVFRRIVK